MLWRSFRTTAMGHLWRGYSMDGPIESDHDIGWECVSERHGPQVCLVLVPINVSSSGLTGGTML